MKRLLCTVAVLCLTLGSAFAELDPSKRFVELGFDVGFSAGQNALGIRDVLTKDLIIDMTDLAKRDFKLNFGFAPGIHFNVNVNGIGVGLQTDLDFHTNFTIDQALFKFLAEGNELNESQTIGMSANLESFLTASIPVRFKVGKLGFKVVPTYFVPIAYLPEPRAQVTYSTNEDGTVRAEATASFDLYTAFDASSILAENHSLPEVSEILKEAKNGGFDLSAVVEYALFDSLDLGGYINMPIYPGTLNHHAYGTATFNFEMVGLLDWATSDPKPEKPFDDPETYWSDLQYDENGYKVNRPFRFGVEAAWRPVGDWFVVHPKLGLAAKNPFGKDFNVHSLYPEYSISAYMTFLYVLGFNVTTAYQDHVFSHNLGLRFNARVFELDMSIGTSNSDFLRSFSLGGLETKVGVKMGF
ncbi:MAG: hypothetical protein J6S91_04760 [Treponema sp.]|nr:hypothetical protein [Treponema sp.]